MSILIPREENGYPTGVFRTGSQAFDHTKALRHPPVSKPEVDSALRLLAHRRQSPLRRAELLHKGDSVNVRTGYFQDPPSLDGQ
ncbi:hypothetical protein FDG2_3202 [Candidatus Protofrankia californiensis]|uniref:Uncharacterized protein n=1 Tax=Candidatus Protofrankia californiensis TaxID=1839754 RepID=A0A1C3NZ47_9ACTN|nr:hypothetical protein FDG2_3202 [Candidatus Protofrankia californiensis]